MKTKKKGEEGVLIVINSQLQPGRKSAKVQPEFIYFKFLKLKITQMPPKYKERNF